MKYHLWTHAKGYFSNYFKFPWKCACLSQFNKLAITKYETARASIVSSIMTALTAWLFCKRVPLHFYRLLRFYRHCHSFKNQKRSLLLTSSHFVNFTAQRWSFTLRISSVNVTKSVVSCRFGHVYWRNP